MSLQFVVAGLTSAANIVVHCLAMMLVVAVVRTESRRLAYTSWALARVMCSVVGVLMAAHVVEVAVWAIAYKLVGAAPAGVSVIYFAFVNYTTLGYGDVVPVARWQLLGPATAMCGILMFGWSTAVIFEVLRRTLQRMDALH
jgi:hypothetical protein